MHEKILLVDDREDNLLSIETILEADGYTFIKASSGRQALKTLLTEFDFALILMDVKMPNLNGFETASLIYEREKLRHIPVIFITAHSYSDENVFKGYRAGAVDYIYKPINPDLLRAKVGVFIELYKQNRKLLAQEQKLIAINKVLENEIAEGKKAEEELAQLYQSLSVKNVELEQANSELVQAREQLADDRTRFLIRAMPHMVGIAAPDGALDYCNQHLIDYTGSNFKELAGWGWTKSIHQDDVELLLADLKKAFASGEIFQKEFRMRRADNQYLWHLALAKPHHNENDVITMWIVTLTNVHDQKVHDEKKDEFIALASHELKTPLTSAKAYTELLETIVEERNDGEALIYAKKANIFINRLNDLISELLDITKIQYGKLQFNMAEFDFDAMLDEAIECTRQSSARHKIVKTGEPINWLTKGDKERLHQVCVNLLSNAVKYSPKADRVEVHVTSDSGEILVAVTDRGIGIPKSDLEKVFNRFYRVEGKTEQFQGLGIGLYISAEIVRRHKGKIWAESEYGKGSTFYFTLPVASVTNDEEPLVIEDNFVAQNNDSKP